MPLSRAQVGWLALAPLALLIAWQPGCSSPGSPPQGDTASVVAELTRQSDAWDIDVYVRTNGTWKVCSVQTTRLPN